MVKEKNGRLGFVPLKWYESTKTYREVYKPNEKEEIQEKPILFTPKQIYLEEVSEEDSGMLPF